MQKRVLTNRSLRLASVSLLVAMVWTGEQTIRVLAEGTATQVPPKDALPPASEQLTWGQEPIEASTSKRGELCLNGLWQFVPMLDPAETGPPGGLAYIHVPGSWQSSEGLPGLASAPAQGPAGRASATAGTPRAPGMCVRSRFRRPGPGAPCCSPCNG